MQLTELSPTAEEATRRVLTYWREHWDWECPTLFGIEREELCAVLSAWPSVTPGTAERASLAVIGAYRELLYGASALTKSDVRATIGVSYEEACALLEQLSVLMEALRKASRQ